MGSTSTSGPGAMRIRPGTVELNADRSADERREFVIVNTGDRPVQIGSHLHLPDANTALQIRPAHAVPGAEHIRPAHAVPGAEGDEAADRAAAHGFRLDIPAGTSQRFEPGASRTVAAVALRGARRVPGIALGKTDGGRL
ncbi:MAG: urease subunit beta [Gordonia sp. (in: high G+C Gram-positive bacteria)]|uniref:urease subunit beta n=1 Tax=Gordonia sp. (in: high G+C Gram-positive bacteria) TaxID=84139 RepID=UPI0039E703C1